MSEEKIEETVKIEEKLSTTKPIRNPNWKEEKLMETPEKGVTTVYEIFQKSVERNGDRPCMGTRPLIKTHVKEVVTDGKTKKWETPEFGEVKYKTYKEVDQIVTKFGDGIMKFTSIKSGDNFGIYEDTRPEWMQSALACARHSIPVVTCYASLGVEALVHVVNETEIVGLLCNSKSIKLLDSLKDQMPTLKYLIYTDKLIDKSEKYEILSFEEVIKLGEENPVKEIEAPKPETIAFLMYTSGSTGVPKGVMILHKNIVAFIGSVNFMWKFTPQTVYIGYLPLAHVLELAAENTILQAGGSIGYGNPRTLTDKGAKPCGDIKAIRPTHMAGVPRVWETIKKGALEKVAASGGVKEYLFKTAFAAKLDAVRNHQDTPFWNWLVFSKLQAELGGRMQAMISGGAPLNKETQEFVKVCFGSIAQGYGLTETCGGLAIQPLDKFTTGNVGHVLPSCEVILESVPDMNYDATPDEKSGKRPEGEILIRGHNVTAGYYKNQKKTDEEWRDGWFHTGDVGRLNKDGTISVIDRKKNLIKLSQGEYVALESLEMCYGASPFVSPNGICIYGDSLEDHIIAVIIPQKTYIESWMHENHMSEKSYSDVLNDEKLINDIKKSLKKLATEGKKKSFEEVVDFKLYDEEWTPDSGLLTAAMKLQRNNIYKKYEEDLKAMYASRKKK
eukprot:gene4142-7452_t